MSETGRTVINGALIVLGSVFVVVGAATLQEDPITGWLGLIGGVLIVIGGVRGVWRARAARRGADSGGTRPSG